MANSRYSEYIEIDPKFESVVDIDADKRNSNLWRDYIVGDDMEKLIDVLCKSLNFEEPDSRRSFWIEGTYGTGKSYASILVKHLMEEKADVIDKYMRQSSRLSAYRNRFMKCRAKSKGDYLVIWKTGCTGIRDGNAILMEAEKAVRDALKEKFGDKADYAEDSLQDAVKKHVNSNLYNWENILETTVLGDDYGDVDKLRECINNGELKALQNTAEVIRQFNWGLIDSLETFKNWISAVIEKNGLSKSGIFFIWDEFTEYVANSDDQTILQQLSEFCKVSPFFMLFVVHRTTEMVERITPERYQLITHRFHSVEFHISTDAAYDLIAGSINIRTGMEEYWNDERKSVVNNIRPHLPNLSGLEDKISEKINNLCPIHPMTVKLLSRVAENYAASQRTMFRFMKDQSTSDQGFVGYINNNGPDDQACWLTPEWLWDYFFTRESDFSDKDTKAAEYIRHYEESRQLVENDDNAHRVFKISMLLLALMSSVKNIYRGRRTKDGIDATQECLEFCLAGVMDNEQISDLLKTMVDSKILVIDHDAYDTARIQLPFKSSKGSDFDAKFSEIDSQNTRYKMFSKDGTFAQKFEKMALDENDALMKRYKICVCAAVTNSINTRLDEIIKELEKYTYKLGLLLVVVDSEPQAVSIQASLREIIQKKDEPRLTIALVKKPLTDDTRKKWLVAITKQEMADESGQTGSANQYKIEADTVVTSWISEIKSAGKMIAYNQTNEYNNIYGMANLRNIIRKNVYDVIFPYAPENIVVTNTAYKSCNDGAPLVGIQRTSKNSQLTSVLKSLENENLLNLKSISDMENAKGSKAAECISKLANTIRYEMDSGQKVNLEELWHKLQSSPYGYYDTIACGILLGYVFSCYKDSKFTWTDSVQSPHTLSEQTLSKMISYMCKGKMSSDYLSAGSVTWQNFSEYLSKIFVLNASQLAEQISGFHSVREAVTKSGAPFWILKYIPEDSWQSKDHYEAAMKIIDDIQVFISQDGDVEEAMSDALELFKGRGNIRFVMNKKFQDKNSLSLAFRSFMFDVSPELEKIVDKLSIQPEELNDKLHSFMQDAIYTWTEEQVKEKLGNIVGEYKYLDAIGTVHGKMYHSIDSAKKDLENLFKHLRIVMPAIEQLKKPWYSALEILYKVAKGKALHISDDERSHDIEILEQFGSYAKDCLSNCKPLLSEILIKKHIECNDVELDAIYDGLKYLSSDDSLSQFEKELEVQIGKISFARNKVILLETWRSMTETDSVKLWCKTKDVPIMWIVPKECQKAISTLIDVQSNNHTVDIAVVSAINTLKKMDVTTITDNAKIESAFLSVVGNEYTDTWNSNRLAVITKAKIEIGNDMSLWGTSDLIVVQKILKKFQQEKAKKEKLDGTKNNIRTMDDIILRDRVTAFLDNHPEFCDEFN